MLGFIKKDLYMVRAIQIVYIFSSFMFILMYVFIKEITFEGYIKDTIFSRTSICCFPLILSSEFSCKVLTAERFVKNCEKYFNSMPVSHTGIVFSKFITPVIFATYGLIIGNLAMFILLQLDNKAADFSDYRRILIVYFFVLIFLAFQMPALIYTGNEALSFMLVLLSTTTLFTLASFLKKMDINEMIAGVSTYVKTHEWIHQNLLSICFCITLISLTISFAISVRLYKRREF